MKDPSQIEVRLDSLESVTVTPASRPPAMKSAATKNDADATLQITMTAPPANAQEVSTTSKAVSSVPTTAEALHQALKTRDESLTLKWLEEASSSLLTARWLFNTDMGDGSGNLFLHMICSLNLAQTLQRLLASSTTTNLFIRNADQETPLHVCAADTRTILLAEGRRRSCLQDMLSASDHRGWSVLDHAIDRRDWKGAEQLRAEGAVCHVRADPCPRLLTLPDPPCEKKYRHPHCIQFASDLHLEFYGSWDDVKLSSLIHPVAPYLALLGDIGIPTDRDLYRRFLLAMAEQFEKVFVLAGNHEYYDSRLSVQEADDLITDICASHPHLVYCKKASISLFEGRVRVLATSTLWTYIPPYAVGAVEMGMMDFKKIRVGPDRSPLTFAQVNEWHHDTVAWISQELRRSSARGERVVVLSHQAPTFQRTSPPNYRGPLLNQTSFGFASNLEMLFRKFNWEHSRMENSVLDSWAFGHTHHNADFSLHGTRLLCNQFGYWGGEEAAGYKPDRVIDLHLDSWIKGGQIWRRFSRTPSY